jgi:hypothetical protein
MRNWRLGLSLVAALAASPFMLSAQDDDLDALSPQELAQAIEEELDDLFDELGLDEAMQYEDEYLADEIMIALSNQGDDADESEMTVEELEEEMEEASTTLPAVVDTAVQAADRMSFRNGSSSPPTVVPVRFLSSAAQRGNQRGWAVAGVAKRQAALGITDAIRRAR